MKMRAAVLREFGAPLSVEDVELASPGAREVLVRLYACGVCHSDLYSASGVDPTGYVPTVLGHEGAGVVEATGEGVSLVSVGDHVLTMFEPECGECAHCRSTETNICLAFRDRLWAGFLPDGTTRLRLDGEPMRHFMGTSAFAEYTVIPEIALTKISPAARLSDACVFACGYSTGIGAATTTAQVRQGATCVVFGAGLVGLGAVAGCRLQGAERIICVDLSSERLALACGQGATETLLGGPDAVATILEATDGLGADYVFEATGDVAVMRQAVESARLGWGLCVLTGVAGRGELLEIVPRFLITGRRVTGCELGGLKGRTGVGTVVERWLAGDLSVEPLITRRIPLERVNEGFEDLERRRGLRTVVTMADESEVASA
jgi:S-(hydroxymethyl)glutathione dehydrogenase/alcohol dehydrogenase